MSFCPGLTNQRVCESACFDFVLSVVSVSGMAIDNEKNWVGPTVDEAVIWSGYDVDDLSVCSVMTNMRNLAQIARDVISDGYLGW